MTCSIVPFHRMIAQGDIPGESIRRVFGRNTAVTGTAAVCSLGGIYRTPQVSGATALRVKAGGNANDTAAGSGARSITLEGLDETGAFVSETVATAGASASTATDITFLRLLKAYVEDSGTYSTVTTGSHAGNIVIEDSGGTENWATINVTNYPKGQTEIGAYTVPLGYTAYVHHVDIIVNANKDLTALVMKREDILATSAPYTSPSIVYVLGPLGESIEQKSDVPIVLPELTDFGVLVYQKVGGTETAACYIEFELKEN